ncbi:MAG: hypothetical protein OSB32_05185 [Candidatus Poseidoniales archaeon]|nr:hypothetical protein [Candidatus Poseidoniales archaeon]|tara:strand:- start:11 stop:904 length:894 start_codon:yes stop_codon:yes gene_type:complete
MVTFKRLMLWFSLFTGVLAFLVLAGNLSPKEQMIFGASILLLIIFLMGTGSGRKVERVRRRSEMEVEESKSEPDQELPAPVQSEEDASARRDAKLSRSRSGEPEPEPEPEIEEVVVSLADDEVLVTVVEENVHVAEEFVAEIDAESMEEADIESFIDDRRGRHALIRRRIEARRREQLADIRSETAKIYQSADESEDILTLVGTENHGHTVLEVSEDIPAGSPVGAVFARIDDTRILKVRLPLDQGFIASSEPLPELPPLPDLGGLPLPPLPDLGDLPLPPPPSSSKLDALRDEMNE